RAKDNKGAWSHNAYYIFYIDPMPSELEKEQAKGIALTEYFIDEDPGFGKATPLEITEDGTAYVADFTAILTELEAGFHNLQIRAKDDQGVWSHNQYYTFYLDPGVAPGNRATQVVEVEYYINLDPGFGKGQKFEFE